MTAKIEFDEAKWKELDALLQFKVSLAFVSDYLGVSRDTIIRRIREEYDLTFAEYHDLKMQRTATKLQQKAIEMALGGNNTMMIFCLKNLAKWSDKIENKSIVEQVQINIDGTDSEL
jgi:AraC-like DNA-binding protein